MNYIKSLIIVQLRQTVMWRDRVSLLDALLLLPLTSARLASLPLHLRPTLSMVLHQPYNMNIISFHLKVEIQLCINCNAVLYELGEYYEILE